MTEQHDDKPIINDNVFVPEEGQRGLLCCNKKSFRCPSLCYEQSSSSSENISRAFDLLFEEVMKIRNKNILYGTKEVNSNLRESLIV